MGWQYEDMDQGIRHHRSDLEMPVGREQTSSARRGDMPRSTLQPSLLPATPTDRNLVGNERRPNHIEATRWYNYRQPQRNTWPMGDRIQHIPRNYIPHAYEQLANETITSKSNCAALAQETWPSRSGSHRAPSPAS